MNIAPQNLPRHHQWLPGPGSKMILADILLNSGPREYARTAFFVGIFPARLASFIYCRVEKTGADAGVFYSKEFLWSHNK